MALPPFTRGRQEHPELSSSEVIFRKAMHQFLGIGLQETVTYYRLLGIPEGEADTGVIEASWERQMTYLRNNQTNSLYGDHVQKLLDAVTKAKLTLLNPVKKAAYDAKLSSSVSVFFADNTPACSEAVSLTSQTGAVQQTGSIQRGQEGMRKKLYAAAILLGIAALGTFVTMMSNSDSDTVPVTEESKPRHTQAVFPMPLPKSSPAQSATPIDAKLESLEEKVSAPPAEPPMSLKSTGPSTVPAQEHGPGQVSTMHEIGSNEFKAKSSPNSTAVEIALVLAEVVEAPQESNPRPQIAQNPIVTVPKLEAVQIDEAKFLSQRESLRKAVENKRGSEKIDSILAFASINEIKNNPEALKAVFVESFTLAHAAKDTKRSLQAISGMRQNPRLFTTAQIANCLALVKDAAKAAGERVVAFSIIDELQKDGFMNLPDAITEKADILDKMTKHVDYRKPTNEALRQATAEQMISLAVHSAEVDPAISDKLMKGAKLALGVQRDAEVSKAFNNLHLASQQQIHQAREIKRATELLLIDPQNAEARSMRGEIYLTRGEIDLALADLSLSNHTLAELSKATIAIMQAGTDAAGKVTLVRAQEWEQAAEKSMQGKQGTMRSIAIKLYTQALAAKTNPLDPFAKPMVQESLQKLTMQNTNVRTQSVDQTSEISKKWQSGLPLMTPEKCGISGKWVQDPKTKQLGVEATPNARLVLPWQIAKKDFEVDLKLTFDRLSGDDAVNLMLPLGKGVTLVVNGWPQDGGFTGLSDVNGVEANRNPSSMQGKILGRGTYVYSVSIMEKGGTASVLLQINGQKVYAWEGETKTLTQHRDWQVNAGQIGFGSHNGRLVLKDVQFMLKKGELEIGK